MQGIAILSCPSPSTGFDLTYELLSKIALAFTKESEAGPIRNGGPNNLNLRITTNYMQLWWMRVLGSFTSNSKYRIVREKRK